MDAPTLRLLARLACSASAFLADVAEIVDAAGWPPHKPGPLILGQPISQRFDMARRKFFKFPVTLPSLDDASEDVSERELAVSIDGTSFTTTGDHDAVDMSFEAPEGATVTLTLVDIDDAGNRSEASDPLTFTVRDTVAPSRPGLMTLGTATEFFKDDGTDTGGTGTDTTTGGTGTDTGAGTDTTGGTGTDTTGGGTGTDVPPGPTA